MMVALRPDRPADLEDGEQMGDRNGGALFIGKGGKYHADCSATITICFPKHVRESIKDPAPSIRRVKDGTQGHWNDWVRACKESPDNRVETSSNLEYAGPFSESVVMGNLAIRLQELNKTLLWDGENMRVTNLSESDEVRVVTTDRFTVINGDPRFDTQYVTISCESLSRGMDQTCLQGGLVSMICSMPGKMYI
jgi:hypothetical protein